MDINYNAHKTDGSGTQPLFAPVLNRYLIQVAKPHLVFSQFGQKVKVPKGKGKQVSWDKYSPLPLAKTPLTEGVAPDGSSMTITRVTGTPDQYGNYVATTDEFDFYKYDPSPEVLKIGELLAENSAETFDSLTCDVVAAGTNVQFAGGKAARTNLTSADVLTIAEIKKAVRTLKNNKARKFKDNTFICILDPSTAHDLMNDELWENVKKHDPKDLYAGEIGELFGVRFIETTETESELLKTYNTTNSKNIHFAYVMGADSYGVTDAKDNVETITHDKHSIGGPLDQYSTMGWKGHHLAKILVDEWLVRIECGVTE